MHGVRLYVLIRKVGLILSIFNSRLTLPVLLLDKTKPYQPGFNLLFPSLTSCFSKGFLSKF